MFLFYWLGVLHTFWKIAWRITVKVQAFRGISAFQTLLQCWRLPIRQRNRNAHITHITHWKRDRQRGSTAKSKTKIFLKKKTHTVARKIYIFKLYKTPWWDLVRLKGTVSEQQQTLSPNVPPKKKVFTTCSFYPHMGCWAGGSYSHECVVQY